MIGGSGITGLLACVLAVGIALAWSTVLVACDVKSQRLPDVLTLPACACALGAAVVWPGGWWGIMWPATYLVQHIVGQDGIGGGDIKLALPLGVGVAVTASAGPLGPMLGVLVAMLLASGFTVAALAFKGVRAMAHGPSMIAGAWIVGLAC